MPNQQSDQDKPAGASANQLVSACRQLHTAIDQLDAAICKHVGISRNDLRCLNLLEYGPASPSEMAAQLDLTTGSMTSLLDRLERLELIQRKASPDDRRKLQIELTARSYETIGPIYQQFAESLLELSTTLSKRENNIVLAVLEQISSLCGQASRFSGK